MNYILVFSVGELPLLKMHIDPVEQQAALLPLQRQMLEKKVRYKW